MSKKRVYIQAFLTLIATTIVEVIVRRIVYQDQDTIDEINFLEVFITVVLLAPILETFLFQHLPQVLYNKMLGVTRLRTLIVAIASTLLFAFVHNQDVVMFCSTLIKGSVLIWFYLKIKSISRKAFWNTTILHSAYNLLLFALMSIGFLLE